EHVLSLGPRHVGVTFGAEGYLWREQGAGGHVAAFSVSVTDTTGAGDAFHGAFALMLAEGRPTAECARLAAAAAALKCTRLGSRASAPAPAYRSAPSWRRLSEAGREIANSGESPVIPGLCARNPPDGVLRRVLLMAGSGRQAPG